MATIPFAWAPIVTTCAGIASRLSGSSEGASETTLEDGGFGFSATDDLRRVGTLDVEGVGLLVGEGQSPIWTNVRNPNPQSAFGWSGRRRENDDGKQL